MTTSQVERPATTPSPTSERSDAILLDVVHMHKAGEAVGVTSICSAHPLVLEATVLQAVEDDTFVLPDQYSRVRRGELDPEPTALAVDRVRDVLRTYAQACNPALRSSL